MAAASVDEIQRQCGADSDDADGMAAHEVMGADGTDESVSTESPRLAVLSRDTADSALRCEVLRLDSSALAGSRGEQPIQPLARDADGQDALDIPCRGLRTEQLAREVLTRPASVRGGVLSAESTADEPRPLHSRIADVDEQHARAS
jgi:hypothetical protein